jgi:hypothetical protein
MSARDLAIGVTMLDDEVLRFYNGMMAATGTHPLEPQRPMLDDPMLARQLMGLMMDRLAEHGMVATVGYRGCAVIAPR